MLSRITRAASIAALGLVSLASQAALVNLTAPNWPPAGSTGLEPVLFNVASANGIQVALGAHLYKESATVPTSGTTFYVKPGLSPNAPTTNARWALDYSINYGTGTLKDYSTRFSIDIDPTAGTDFKTFILDKDSCGAFGACDLSVYDDSQNASFIFSTLYPGFDPFAAGDFSFMLDVRALNVREPLVSVGIDVQVVPEPGSLALLGLGLAGLAAVRKRKQA